MDFLTLDWKGVLLSLIEGVLFLVLGGPFGYFFLLTMFLFLVLSALATWVGLRYKKKLGIYQKPRGMRNVLANGMPPLIMVVLFFVASTFGNQTVALLAIMGFVASVAAITADKFNSEIGVLSDGLPHMIFTWKRVKKGTSGGISPLGLVSGVFGALLVSLLLLIVAGKLGTFSSLYPFTPIKAVLSVTIAGFAGSFVDSVLGYYEEKGIGNKFTTNFACGISAGVIAMLIFAVL